MICRHQFVLIQQIEKFKEGTQRIEKVGAQAGCLLCGEVRTVMENGEVVIDHVGISD